MAARPHRASIIEPAPSAGLCSRGRRARRLRVLLVEPECRQQQALGSALDSPPVMDLALGSPLVMDLALGWATGWATG